MEAVEDCTITSDLQLNRKLHLGIQMLLTATYLESTIINDLYYCSSWTGDSFAGGPISVDYSVRKLQYVIKNEGLNHTKNRKTCYSMMLALVFWAIKTALLSVLYGFEGNFM